MENHAVNHNCGFAVEEDNYGVRARQKELLSMLKEVDAFLRSNGVEYSLGAGTLLGAVRHNGFIPWDDDVDIIVDRKNYSKILKLFEEKKNETRFVLNKILWIYRIQDKDDDTNGLKTPTIDIFAYDHCPNGKFKRNCKFMLLKLLQGMMKREKDYSKFSFFYKVCLWGTSIVGKLFTHNFKFKMYDRIARIGSKEDSEYLSSCFSSFNNLELRHSKTLFNTFVEHKFEDTVMPITAEYDQYLTLAYGDYMTPPKQEDRVAQHM